MKDIEFILTTQTGTFTLDHSPDGWDESMITTERSEKYFGVFRSWTIPLKFIKDGAGYLRDEFYSFGFMASASIVIQKLDKTTDLYNVAFRGVLDFSTWMDTEKYVEVKFTDSGLPKYLKDNGGTEYEVENSYMTDSDVYAQEDIRFTYNSLKAYFGTQLMNVARSLVDKMTGGKVYGTDSEFAVVSDYLDGEDYSDNDHMVVLVPGSQWIYDGARFGEFKTTFESFYQSINSLFNLGIGIEYDQGGNQTLRIEPKDYFLSTDVGYDFGEVENLSINLASKFIYNRVKIGYPAQDYQYDDLKNTEVNATSKWKQDTDFNSVELDLVSKYRGDGNGIINTFQIINDGEANNDIDDIYFVELYFTSGAWKIWQGGKVKDTNDNKFLFLNPEISTRRNLTRWADFLSDCTFGIENRELKFTSGENLIKYYSSSIYDGILPYESETADLELGQGGKFMPLIFEVETACPADFITTLQENMNDIYTFTYNGIQLGGYIMKVETKVSGKSAQKITFLASYLYRNNIVSLIDRKTRP